MIDAHRRSGPKGRELTASLAVSGVLVVFALAGLSLQGNWSKVMRVLLAWLTYGAVLLGMAWARQALFASEDRVPYWLFALAGAGAGVVSGLLHPAGSTRLVVVSGLLTAVLLGGLHYLVVREWRGIMARMASGTGRASDRCV